MCKLCRRGNRKLCWCHVWWASSSGSLHERSMRLWISRWPGRDLIDAGWVWWRWWNKPRQWWKWWWRLVCGGCLKRDRMYLIEKYEYIYFVKPVLSSAILPSLWYFLLITCVISSKAVWTMQNSPLLLLRKRASFDSGVWLLSLFKGDLCTYDFLLVLNDLISGSCWGILLR